jgi:hypothetical protein
MNLSEMTKAQKQYIVLGVLVGAGVIALSVFGIKQSLTAISEKRTQLEAVSEQLAKADRALSGYHEVNRKYEDTVQRLRAYEQYMPPDRNYYSWATEIIYGHGKVVGLEVDAVDEITDTAIKRPDGVVALESYSLRIAAQGSFEEILEFARRLKKDQPLLRITGLDISLSKDPEVQIAQIFVQWPFGIETLSKGWEEAEQVRRQIQNRETADG